MNMASARVYVYRILSRDLIYLNWATALAPPLLRRPATMFLIVRNDVVLMFAGVLENASAIPLLINASRPHSYER